MSGEEKKKRYGRSILKCLGVGAALYLVYAVCTGILPFLRGKTVSEDFASSVSVSDFYGDEPCVDRVALVEYPTDSLDTRLHMLDEARERIDISYYAMHMGSSTDLFLGALLDAADRGVHIRILVDGQFGGLTEYNRTYAAALGGHENIELKNYNPPKLLKPWTWNGRLHDKYILIDDRLLLMGGRNIGDKYFAPDGYGRQLSFDRDVLVYNTQQPEEGTGSVLYSVRDYMDRLWNGETVCALYEEDTEKGEEKRQALLENFRQYRQEHPGLFDHTGDDYWEWTFPANRVSFFHNDTDIGVKEPKTGYVLGQLLLSAEESVVLQSPYVILDPWLTELLGQIGQSRVDAAILTNSVASSPNPTACIAYYGDRSAILETGIRLWEYQGSDSIHAKTYLIDNRMSVVGSYNLDPRSAYLDTEMMLAIDSPEFTAHLRKTQEEYFRQALEVGRDGSYLTGTGVEERTVSFAKWAMVYGLYLPVKLFKQLT